MPPVSRWQENFYNIISEVTDGLVCIDRDWRFTFVSRGAEKTLRSSSDELLGRTVQESFPTIRGTSFEHGIRKALETQEPYYVEDYCATLFKWYRCKFLPDAGSVIAIFTDVTSEKLAEWRRNQISAIVDSLSEAIILIDGDGRVLDWKGRTSSLLQISEENARRADLFQLVPFPADLEARMRDCMRTKRRINIHNVEVTRNDGSRIILSGTFAPLSMESGSYNSFLLCARDNTHSHRLYENLLQAKTHAEEANHGKSVFMANMSHEIRTPITVILGYLERLRGNNLDKGAHDRMLALVEKNARHLTSLLDDLLDLSAMDSGAECARNDCFNVLELIQEVVAIIQPMADAKKLDFRVDLDPALNMSIKCDASKLRRILINLLNNAVKYTDSGFVALEALVQGNREMKFFVRDSGRGMEHEEQDIIFDLFSRCENARKVAQGFGLGLALSRKLATVLGGDVRLVESEPGVGSVFEFCCPCTEVEKPQRAYVRGHEGRVAKALQGLKVLVVEDCPEIAELTNHSLRQEGAEVVIADNGTDALHCLLDSAYDAVMLDYELPDMEAPHLIRQLRTFNSRTPIIAVTAHTQQDIFQKLQDVGVSDVLIKPYPMEALTEALQRCKP